MLVLLHIDSQGARGKPAQIRETSTNTPAPQKESCREENYNHQPMERLAEEPQNSDKRPQ